MDFIKNCGSEGPSPSAQQAAEPRFFHTFSRPGLFSTAASRLSHVKHVWRNPEEGSKIAPKEHPCQHATRTFRRGCKATFTGLFTQELMKTNGIYVAAAAGAVLVPLALFLRTFSASTLPKPKPYVGPLPSATPPKEMAVFGTLRDPARWKAGVRASNGRLKLRKNQQSHAKTPRRRGLLARACLLCDLDDFAPVREAFFAG